MHYSKLRVKTGKNVLHKQSRSRNKGKPSYTKHGGKQGTARSVGVDVKLLDPRKRKIKGPSVGGNKHPRKVNRDTVLIDKFERARRKIYGLSNKEAGGLL